MKKPNRRTGRFVTSGKIDSRGSSTHRIELQIQNLASSAADLLEDCTNDRRAYDADMTITIHVFVDYQQARVGEYTLLPRIPLGPIEDLPTNVTIIEQKTFEKTPDGLWQRTE